MSAFHLWTFDHRSAFDRSSMHLVLVAPPRKVASMAEHWIEASRALELTGSTYRLCERSKAGLVKSRAQLLLIGNERHEGTEIPSKFWWAEGHEALDQDWASGDFST